MCASTARTYVVRYQYRSNGMLILDDRDLRQWLNTTIACTDRNKQTGAISRDELWWTLHAQHIHPDIYVTDDWAILLQWQRQSSLTASAVGARVSAPLFVFCQTQTTRSALVRSQHAQIWQQLAALHLPGVDILLDAASDKWEPATSIRLHVPFQWHDQKLKDEKVGPLWYVEPEASVSANTVWREHIQRISECRRINNARVWMSEKKPVLAKQCFTREERRQVEQFRAHTNSDPNAATSRESLAQEWIQIQLACITTWSDAAKARWCRRWQSTVFDLAVGRTQVTTGTNWSALYFALYEFDPEKTTVPRSLVDHDATLRDPLVWMLNLQRRNDRWCRMLASSQFLRKRAVRVNAVDGLFDGDVLDWFTRAYGIPKKFVVSPNAVACAVGHAMMWELLIERLSDDNDVCLITEDDIAFGPVFARDWPILKHWMYGCNDWDLLWLGWHQWPAERGENFLDLKPASSAPVPMFPRVWRVGGTFGYCINRRGAKRILQAWKESPGLVTVGVGIDTWMMHLPTTALRQYACPRPVIWSSILNDSDIQPSSVKV